MVLGSLLVWNVFQQSMSYPVPVFIAAAAYLLFISLLSYRNNQGQQVAKRTIGVGGWLLVLYAVGVLAINFIMKTITTGLLIEPLQHTSFGYFFFFLAMAGILFFIGILLLIILMPYTLNLPAYARHRLPMLGLLLARKRGILFIQAAPLVLLFIWVSMEIDRRIAGAAGTCLAFFIILLGLTYAQRHVTRSLSAGEAAKPHSPRNLRIMRLLSLLPLVSSAVLLLIHIGMYNMNKTAIYGFVSALGMLLICYVFVHFRLTVVLKVLFTVLSLFAFTLFALYMWYMSI